MLFQAFILLALALFIGISNSAGIGGGSIINVLLITGLSYSAKQSIVISYIFLMGGGLASFLSGARKVTSSGKRCIDYDLVILTLPLMMSGAIVGAILNQIISQLIITIIFIILIINLMMNSCKKLKESEREQCSTQKEIFDEGKIENVSAASTHENTKEQIQKKQKLQQILNQQKALIPHDKLKLLAVIYFYTIVIILLRGGKTFDSAIGIQSCGVVSYLLVVIHILFSYFLCKRIEVKILQREKQKESLGFEYADPKEKRSLTKMNTNMLTGFLVGVMGSMVGQGGGLILVPVWLKAGIDKEIVVNSTPPLIFYLASISFLTSVLLGQYSSFWVVVMYFFLSFSGSYLVKRFINYVTEKYGLKRLIYILLIVLMVLSLLAFLPIQIIKFQADPADFTQFGSFC